MKRPWALALLFAALACTAATPLKAAADDPAPAAIAACPYPDDREQLQARRNQPEDWDRSTRMSESINVMERQADEAGEHDPERKIELLRQALKLRVQLYGAMGQGSGDHFNSLAEEIESRVNASRGQGILAAMSQQSIDATLRVMLDKAAHAADPAAARAQAEAYARMLAQAREKAAAQPAHAGDDNQLLDEAAAMRDCAIRNYAAFATADSASAHFAFNTRIQAADAYGHRGRKREAEHYLRDAYAGVDLLYPSDADNARHEAAAALGENLRAQGRWAEAEPYLRQAGPRYSASLAEVLEKQGRYADAESLRRGTDKPATSTADANSEMLARNLAAQGRYAEAAAQMRQLLAGKAEYPPPPAGWPKGTPPLPDAKVATLRQSLGEWEAVAHQYEAASADLETACDDERQQRWVAGSDHSLEMVAGPDGGHAVDAAACYRLLLSTLWSASAALPARREAYRNAAFMAAQNLLADQAGAALSASAARQVAAAVGAGGVTDQLEENAKQLDALNQKFDRASLIGSLMTKGGDSAYQYDLAKLLEYSNAVQPESERMLGLTGQLLKRVPDYIDLRQPLPLDIGSLQAAPGPEQRLLRDDEVLVQYLALGDAEPGLVFVVTHEGSAWARAGMSGKELDATVATLRAQIDPDAYRGTADGVATDAAFDPARAYALYHALFGDPAVERLLGDPRKTTLLLVPSGALVSFPPGLLVTSPPAEAGPDGPVDPRAVAWLLRSKAVAVLPTVSSLRTLRRVLPQRVASAPDPLLVLADPDFGDAAHEKPCDSAARRGLPPRADQVQRDGEVDAAALFRELARKPLPCSRDEGLGLQKVLGGEVLFGAAATESELKRRSAAGTLARVRVLAFATHGLVTGDFRLAEPALALAVPPAGSNRKYDDGLLTAGEVAALNLNADWVILSACNTAAPDQPGAPGLSGLSRAFFFAGARALLVSQWSVNDAVAADMVSSTIVLQQHGESRARALQQRSLEILDHRSANPADWGVFTLIGDPS